MSIVEMKVCDICGKTIETDNKGPRVTALVNLIRKVRPEVEDICISCVDWLGYPEIEKKKRASKEHAHAMRKRLCNLVNRGTRRRDEILIQLTREFPHYTNIDSINKRISELMSPSEAHLVTRRAGSKYSGKVAKVDSNTILYFD